MLVFFKKIFVKKEEIKTLQAPVNVEKETKNDFIKSLKVNIALKTHKNKVETLVCEGDGLGIQKKITF
jgi:hypothetical protein